MRPLRVAFSHFTFSSLTNILDDDVAPSRIVNHFYSLFSFSIVLASAPPPSYYSCVASNVLVYCLTISVVSTHMCLKRDAEVTTYFTK